MPSNTQSAAVPALAAPMIAQLAAPVLTAADVLEQEGTEDSDTLWFPAAPVQVLPPRCRYTLSAFQQMVYGWEYVPPGLPLARDDEE